MQLGARANGKDPNETDNWCCQNKDGKCSYPLPEIHSALAIPIALFEVCGGRWKRNDFDGSRQFLDPAWLKIEAHARGVELDADTLDVIGVCESVIREQDAERVAAAAPPKT